MARLDPRVKLIFTLLGLISCGFARNFITFTLLSIPIIVGFTLLMNKKDFIHRFVLFLPLIIVSSGFQILFTPGKIVTQGITYEGLHNGLLLGARVGLAIWYSLIFTVSTTPIKIANSLDWLTMGRLELGKTVLIALRFVELVKDGIIQKKSLAYTLKYAINSLNAEYQT